MRKGTRLKGRHRRRKNGQELTIVNATGGKRDHEASFYYSASFRICLKVCIIKSSK